MNKAGAVQFLLREDVTHGRVGKRQTLFSPTVSSLQHCRGDSWCAVNSFYKQGCNDRVKAGMFTGET
jgi:hypothetical protein